MCVCLWTWAGDGLCLEFFACVCVFFSSVNAKKGEGTKTHLKKICACARVRGEERECPRFLHGAPPLLSNPLQISAVAGAAVAAAAAVVTFGSNFEVRPQRLSRD